MSIGYFGGRPATGVRDRNQNFPVSDEVTSRYHPRFIRNRRNTSLRSTLTEVCCLTAVQLAARVARAVGSPYQRSHSRTDSNFVAAAPTFHRAPAVAALREHSSTRSVPQFLLDLLPLEPQQQSGGTLPLHLPGGRPRPSIGFHREWRVALRGVRDLPGVEAHIRPRVRAGPVAHGWRRPWRPHRLPTLLDMCKLNAHRQIRRSPDNLPCLPAPIAPHQRAAR